MCLWFFKCFIFFRLALLGFHKKSEPYGSSHAYHPLFLGLPYGMPFHPPMTLRLACSQGFSASPTDKTYWAFSTPTWFRIRNSGLRFESPWNFNVLHDSQCPRIQFNFWTKKTPQSVIKGWLLHLSSRTWSIFFRIRNNSKYLDLKIHIIKHLYLTD